MSDPEAAETNGHRPPVPSHASKVDDRVRLENKPILEWSRDDWQLWAAGLNESQDEPVAGTTVQPEPVDLQDPVQPEPVDLQDPVQPQPVEEQPEPVQPETVGDEPETPAMEAAPTETVFATASLTPALETEVHETPSSVPSESSPSALQLSPSLSATRPWPAQLQEAAVQTARTRARSALGLMVIAVVVGALVAGLVTCVIMVTSLVLRRALGS